MHDRPVQPPTLLQDPRAFNDVFDLLKQENFHAVAVVQSKSSTSSRFPAVGRLTEMGGASKQFLLIGTWGAGSSAL
jgi:hypothetical protein